MKIWRGGFEHLMSIIYVSVNRSNSNDICCLETLSTELFKLFVKSKVKGALSFQEMEEYGVKTCSLVELGTL